MESRVKGVLAAVMITLLSGLLGSCGSSTPTLTLGAEDRYNEGKKKFLEGDYLEAINDFEVVKLQFTGSAVADSSQLYLGESHYKREEFLLAAEEFQNLRRNFPTSPLVPLAQHYIAMCYYNLSPKSYLDQKYTVRAIDEFQTFIEYYPKSDLAPDAEAKIQELDARLAEKEYNAAELYMKLERYKAATYYYNSVVEKYHDSPFAEPALLGKIRSLMARKKYDEAKPEVDKFLDKYPQSKYKSEVESVQRDINEHLQSDSADGSRQQQIDSGH